MRAALFTLLAFILALAPAKAIEVALTFTSPTCFGYTDGTATANPSGGVGPYAFMWSNGQNGPTTLGVGAGVYSVTVTDQNGETVIGSVEVTQPQPLLATITASGTNCDGAFAPITANVTGGMGNIAYTWNTGATTPAITPTAWTSYFVTVTDANGCSAAALHNTPVSSQIFTTFHAQAPACAGGANGGVTVNVFGNYAPFTWIWSTGTHANQNLAGVASGVYSVTITDAQGCTKAESVTVPSNLPVQVVAEMTNVPCFGMPGGVGKALVSGGVSPYTYQWNTGFAEPVYQNLPAGVYSVTVTDGNGCTASASGIVTQPDPLQNTVVSVTEACGPTGGATVQPSGGTPPYMITWNGGLATGPTIANVPAGTYYVCLIDANHCQLDIQVNIPGGPGLNVMLITEKASCTGVNNGQATAVATNGSGSYSYAWSNGAPPLAHIDGLPGATNITVTVTDNVTGCQGTATAFISVHGQIGVQVSDIDTDCANNPAGSATATALSGQAPFTFVWGQPNNPTQYYGPTITGLTAGAYAVTMTDATGCTTVGVADIGASGSVNAQFNTTVQDCTPDSVKLIVNDASVTNGSPVAAWHWTVQTASGTTELTGVSNFILPLPVNTSGSITLTVTLQNGCSGSVSQPFSVGAPPQIAIVGVSPTFDCANGPVPVTVEGDSSYVYSWEPMTALSIDPNNPQTGMADPDSTQIYTVMANNLGCLAMATVEVIRIPEYQLSVNPVQFITCNPTETLTAQLNVPIAGLHYEWLNAAGDSIGGGASLIVSGSTGVTTYTLVASDLYGCTETATSTVTGNAVDIDAAIFADSTACANADLTGQVVNLDSTDILIYQWSASNPSVTISDPMAPSPSFSGPAGTYMIEVLVTNQHNCTQTLSAPLTFETSGSVAGQIESDLCNGLDVQFENTGSVAGTWNFGDGSALSAENDPEHAYASAGQYIISFTPDELCYAPFIDTIDVLTVPAVNAGFVPDVQNCFGVATFQFQDTTQSQANIAAWQWTFQPGGQTSNEQNPTITFTQTGMISATLVVTDINGCSDDMAVSQIPVNIVQDTIAGAASICLGNTVSLNPDPQSGYTYAWTSSPADPTLDPAAGNPSVSPVTPTTYSVTITKGNCTVVQNVAINLNAPATIAASNDTIVCELAPVTVGAVSTNATQYAWAETLDFNPVLATTPYYDFMPDGMVYVMATTADGCTAIDSVRVTYRPVDLDYNPAQTNLCNETEVQLSIISNNPTDVLTYSWSHGLPPIANPTATLTSDAVISAVVTNQFGCKDTVEFVVNVFELALDLTVLGSDTIVAGDTASLAAVVTGGSLYTYSWSPEETLSGAGLSNPDATPAETTLYTVTVTDTSGCAIEGNVTVFVIALDCVEPYLFVPNVFTPNGDDNNDFFRLRGADITELYFAVWDRWGEKVYETTEIGHQGWDGTYNNKPGTPDSYAWYARVRCGNGQYWERKGNVTLMK